MIDKNWSRSDICQMFFFLLSFNKHFNNYQERFLKKKAKPVFSAFQTCKQTTYVKELHRRKNPSRISSATMYIAQWRHCAPPCPACSVGSFNAAIFKLPIRLTSTCSRTPPCCPVWELCLILARVLVQSRWYFCRPFPPFRAPLWPSVEFLDSSFNRKKGHID